MTRSPSPPLWYSLLAVLLSVMLAAGAAVVYADRTARESERKWCSVVSTLDSAYRETPPQTELGRQLAADIAELRRQFGCPAR